MNIQFKGIKIGGLIITTEKLMSDSTVKIDPQEVWDIFKKAIKEGKLIVGDTDHHQK